MYGNRKRVRGIGVKVSINEYESKALEVIEAEEGIVPATFYYTLGASKNTSEVRRLRQRYFELIDHFISLDNSSRVA